jgi:hypothetical protein
MISRVAKIAVSTVALAGVLAACDSSVTQPALKNDASVALANGGNSAAAQACRNNGYLNFQRPDGTLFRNVGECVAFVANGGTLQPIGGAPTITEIDSHGINCVEQPWTVTVFMIFSGGTGTVNGHPMTSGVDLTIPQSADGAYEFVVTNGTQSVSETRHFSCT